MEAQKQNLIDGIIADRLFVNIEDVRPEVDLREGLNADSLDVIELTLAFEEEFDIEIPDSAIDGIRTVGDIHNYLEGRLK